MEALPLGLEEVCQTVAQSNQGPMAEELQTTDKVVENPLTVRSHKNVTGYPFDLTPEEVMRLIYFFGSRKASAKAMNGPGGKLENFTANELSFLKECFGWFGFVAKTSDERRAAYRAVIIRFRTVLAFLRDHPAFLTKEIRDACEEHGYKRVLKNIVMVVDEHGQVKPRVVTDSEKKHIIPIGKMDTMLWDFQNVALDKLKMIVDSITFADVKKSNLGAKSKAMRDIYSVIHMARQANKNPNMTLVNINVNADDTKQKMKSYTDYIARNRDS